MTYPGYYEENELLAKIRRCSPQGPIECFEAWHNVFALRIGAIYWLGNLETGRVSYGTKGVDHNDSGRPCLKD